MSISINKGGLSLVVMAFLLIAPIGALDAGPLVIKDLTQEWYFPEWLGTSPYAPSFQVRDTTNKYGRYAKTTKIITLKDLIKFHGHFCGGLVESAGALQCSADVSASIVRRFRLGAHPFGGSDQRLVPGTLCQPRQRFRHLADNCHARPPAA